MRHCFTLILLSVIIGSCADNSGNVTDASNSETIENTTEVPDLITSDTFVVDEKAVLFIEPDSIAIEKQKKEVGEESLRKGADDYLFYMSNSFRFLDSVKLKMLIVKDKKFMKFISSNNNQQLINLHQLPELWNIYFFDPSRDAKRIDMTSIEEEYKSYFKQ